MCVPVVATVESIKMTQPQGLTYTLVEGNNIDVLKQYPDNHFDSVVTDPPYGIDFLGKDWDSHTGSIDTYRECLRVLKPGGHLLAFSAARTYHHLAMSVELAGFEIRDQIMWLYSSGFPKSQDVGRSIQRSLGVKKTKKNDNHRTKAGDSLYAGGHQKAEVKGDVVCTDLIAQQWEGWGTALKPAHEPIVVARKPLKVSVAQNVQVWGTGALNIDATRIPLAADDKFDIRVYANNENNEKRDTELTDIDYGDYAVAQPHEGGRFPSNVVGEIPDYQKYFYCPKVSRRERHIGFELPPALTGDVKGCYDDNGNRLAVTMNNANNPGNNHPTVKPQALMEYLIKLVTPANGKVLDPFNGSGSTGMAATRLGHEYVGIDLDPKYIEISRRRIEAWNQPANTYDSLFTEEAK